MYIFEFERIDREKNVVQTKLEQLDALNGSWTTNSTREVTQPGRVPWDKIMHLTIDASIVVLQEPGGPWVKVTAGLIGVTVEHVPGIVEEVKGSSIEDTEDSFIDPSSFLDFQVIVRLPGELVETNGFYDLSSQGVALTINGKEQQTLHAVSELKSWTNLSILLWLSSAAVSLFLIGVGIVAVVWSKRRRPEASGRAAENNALR